MSYVIWKILPFAVCLRLIVNCRQNKKTDEKFAVSLIIFRQIFKESIKTVKLLVKCVYLCIRLA